MVGSQCERVRRGHDWRVVALLRRGEAVIGFELLPDVKDYHGVSSGHDRQDPVRVQETGGAGRRYGGDGASEGKRRTVAEKVHFIETPVAGIVVVNSGQAVGQRSTGVCAGP